ncbi:hypothetical protein UFOVP407_13 [uncultured Caudovirales phage]|uniref:Uncharacterized protein n=1 Tax=uncultured Caudovirales phage TaxID=2100421 RepID=A0A6J5M3U4_9CAUD|nr:hypothetical protein UFOVP407_13 [uncultured Caudovirales phage]
MVKLYKLALRMWAATLIGLWLGIVAVVAILTR